MWEGVPVSFMPSSHLAIFAQILQVFLVVQATPSLAMIRVGVRMGVPAQLRCGGCGMEDVALCGMGQDDAVR